MFVTEQFEMNWIKCNKELFFMIPENCQKLYVWLFLRKHRWMLLSRIVYDDIAKDLSTILESLTASNLISDGWLAGHVYFWAVLSLKVAYMS